MISEVVLDTDGFYNKLRKVNISKAYGCEGITPKEMEIVAKEICCSIAHKGKMSYDEGKYPTQWKIGKFKLLHKGSDSGECGNYRPLTVLSIPVKINESIICDTNDPYLNEVLQKNHWGYR